MLGVNALRLRDAGLVPAGISGLVAAYEQECSSGQNRLLGLVGSSLSGDYVSVNNPGIEDPSEHQEYTARFRVL
jgi:hypothetical protein